ncbi:MAG: hypothetical protein L3K18_01225 [Thermoplasmata archaeon]|nr:hypothetical protein [Thermoplasmata archaeon]MCI4355750.1 hypothetical protein [Thermoplasmata archaeon]
MPPELVTGRRLSQATIEWLGPVARPGESPDETIVRLVHEVERDDTIRSEVDLLARRDALLHLDDL